ncbi:hypothetical protein CVIRNUC_000014 [Coccomyxa viridis]|uniref:Purple acid phosphatase n=1 Tax=Coccomyxa viridis TaxID=1274662 RepID=A0AAV1HP08_9CHLO|nr:hypothetical protein CVIRNUC_000014 [Coccomyxa viridis]
MYISWVTGDYVFSVTAPASPPPITVASKVQFGELPDKLYYETEGQQTYYVTNSTGYTVKPFTDNYYLSPSLHHVLLQNLKPGTTYYYRVGDPAVSQSDVFYFKTPLPTSFNSFPQRLGVIADLGQTPNSSDTIQHLVANKPEFAVLIGDLTYSDDYTADAIANRYYTGQQGGQVIQPTLNPIATSYQPRWDSWGRLMQAFANTTSLPFMTVEGNHELENKNVNNNPTPFASYMARYRTPYQQSKSTTPLYYSWNLGGVHFIMIGAYELQPQPAPYTSTNMLISATQIAWITADLAAVDRSVTPWIVAMFHPHEHHQPLEKGNPSACLSGSQLLYASCCLQNKSCHLWDRCALESR